MKTWRFFAILLSLVVIAETIFISRLLQTAPAHAREADTSSMVRVLSVYDGDTFTIDGSRWSPFPNLTWKIRIMGIDTPEMKGDCMAERLAARRAKTELTRMIVTNGNVVILSNVKHDKYGGRFDADVTLRDGKSIKNILLQMGLAMSYTGEGPKPNWCEILR